MIDGYNLVRILPYKNAFVEPFPKGPFHPDRGGQPEEPLNKTDRSGMARQKASRISDENLPPGRSPLHGRGGPMERGAGWRFRSAVFHEKERHLKQRSSFFRSSGTSGEGGTRSAVPRICGNRGGSSMAGPVIPFQGNTGRPVESGSASPQEGPDAGRPFRQDGNSPEASVRNGKRAKAHRQETGPGAGTGP